MEKAASSAVTTRLSVMMFIQFFVWGAWYTMVGQYLAKIGMAESIGWVYTVGPIAAILSPLFLGMVADRFFASQKVLSALMLVGGICMFIAPGIAQSCAASWATTKAELAAAGITVEQKYGTGSLGIFPPVIGDHLPFIGVLFLHMLCFMPTLGLTNTIAFRNIQDQEKQFPLIRVFGTIGWIVAGAVLSYGLKLDETPWTLYAAGGACILLSIYSLFLPDTPPSEKGKSASAIDLLGLRAVGLMKNPSFAVFVISSMLICIPLAAYYAMAAVYINNAGFKSAAGVMIWGQVSEIVFMLLIPFFFRRLGVKWMLAVGMLAWVARYGLFAGAAGDGVAWMIFLGIVLHGICYDFFFVTGFIYTDKRAPEALRGQAQGFLVLVTQGIGLGLGAPIMQRILNSNKATNAAELTAQATDLRDQAAKAADGGAALWDQASALLLQATHWKTIWTYPAIMAAVIAVIFFIAFWDKSADGDDAKH